MQTATEIKAEFSTLSTAERAERLISAGFVRPNGNADYVSFYEAILAERSDREPISERAEMMAHFVNRWAPEYSARVIKNNWETYSQQVDIDGNYDAIDEFISDYGMANIGFYDSFADMMEDYDRWAVMAFIEEFGITNIEHFPEAYQGTFRSEAEFAEEFCTQQNEIPFYIVADWQATWDYSLRHDYTYDEDSGAVFAQNF
jgi:hypothetical protein